MANYRMFSDIGGATEQLVQVFSMRNEEFSTKFPGIKGKRSDSFSMIVGMTAAGAILPLTRSIKFKSNPSRHECDARCMHATGRTMQCECSCGGKNHGKHA